MKSIDTFQLPMLKDCGEECCRADHSYGPAVRDYFLLHAVLSGCGVFHNSRGDFHIGPNQAFVIFPGEITVYQADTLEPWHYVWVGFKAGQSGTALSSMEVTPHSPVIDLGKHCPEIVACMRTIYRDASSLQMADMAASGGILRLLSLLSECSAVRGGASTTAEQYYRRALWLMQHENSHSPLTVQALSDAVGLSRSQLFRVFRQVCGKSPQEVLIGMRRTQAIQLISQTTLPLEMIAEACCFSSAQHLCDSFRAAGLPPPSAHRRHGEEA